MSRPVVGLASVFANCWGAPPSCKALPAHDGQGRRDSPPPRHASPGCGPSAAEKLEIMERVHQGGSLDVMQIMKILPHRYPFLMVDHVTKIDGTKITGVKNVSVNEPFFEGHFPGHPIMPGVLQLEAIAQVAGILTLRQAENMGKLAYFMAAENVKWRKPVRPGDTLIIEVELVVLTRSPGFDFRAGPWLNATSAN